MSTWFHFSKAVKTGFSGVSNILNVMTSFVVSTFGMLLPFLLVYNLILFFNGYSQYGYFDIKLFFNFANDTMRNNTLLFLMSNQGQSLLESSYNYALTIQLLSQFPQFIAVLLAVPLFAVSFTVGTATYFVTVLFIFAYLMTCDVLDAIIVIGRFLTNPQVFFVQRNPITYISF